MSPDFEPLHEAFPLTWMDILKTLILFVINPIYTSINHLASYTTTLNFRSTHYVFWHVSLIFFWRAPNIFYDDVFSQSRARGGNYCAIMLSMMALCVKMPKVQNRKNMKIGYLGAVLSTWVLILSVHLSQIESLTIISRWMFHLALLTVFIFFSQTCSFLTNAYIEIPLEHRPFFKKNSYVFLIGILHILTATAAIISKHWLDILLLVLLSFFLSVDAYCVLTLKIYSIRENQVSKEKYEAATEVICHVVVDTKEDGSLPPGHQLEGHLKIDKKWYRLEY